MKKHIICKYTSIFVIMCVVMQTCKDIPIALAMDNSSQPFVVDTSGNSIKNELEKNGNVVTQYTNQEDKKLKTILWTKGVTPPKMGGDNSDFKRIETPVNGQVGYVEYKAPYVANHGWFDVNKSEDRVMDQNLCFAAAASNGLHWWLQQNSDYIDKYLKQHPDYSKKEQLAKMRNSFASQGSSGIYQSFVQQFAYRKNGYWPDILIDQFINGYYPKDNGGTNDSPSSMEELTNRGPNPRGGYFYDVFGTKLLTQRRIYEYSYNVLARDIKECLLKGDMILLSYAYFGNNMSHAVTLWGAEFDLDGQISAVYLTDSDDETKDGMVRYNVVNQNGTPMLSTSVDKKGGSPLQTLTILSRGEDTWRQVLGETKTVLNLEWSNTDVVYNGKPQKPVVKATNIRENDDVQITVETEKTEAGTYKVNAILSGKDANKYELPSNFSHEFHIQKAKASVLLNKLEGTSIFDVTVSGIQNEALNGTIQFKDNDVVIADKVELVNGKASYQWNNPGIGVHHVQAVFCPTTNGLSTNYTESNSDVVSFELQNSSMINAIPVITANDKVIEVGDIFDPLQGVSAYDQEDHEITLSQDNVIKNDVNPNVAGVYEVVYQVRDSLGATATKTIHVTVKEKAVKPHVVPTIVVNDKVIEVGDIFDPLQDVHAYDQDNREITLSQDNVIKNDVNPNVAGVYEVVYQVSDQTGATATKTIYVTVKEKAVKPHVAPTIVANDKVIEVGDTFDPLKDVHAYDQDNQEIVLTQDNVIKNEVNPNVAGVYEVVYQVSDQTGVTATKTIHVTVKEKVVRPHQSPIIIASNQEIKVGDIFDPLKGVHAYDQDNQEIVLTQDNVIKNEVNPNVAGVYEVVYQVSDQTGVTATKTIHVTVKEKVVRPHQSPIIIASNQEIKVGDIFDPLKGVHAYDQDNQEIVLTQDNVIKNEVNPNVAGVYEVVYQVPDQTGASVYKLIYVSVKSPISILPQEMIETESVIKPMENVMSSNNFVKIEEPRQKVAFVSVNKTEPQTNSQVLETEDKPLEDEEVTAYASNEELDNHDSMEARTFSRVNDSTKSYKMYGLIGTGLLVLVGVSIFIIRKKQKN